MAPVIYLKSGCIIRERSQREVGMVISPISVGGVAENRIMHDNELSLHVSGMIQRNLRKTYLRIILVCTCVYVRVYRYVHVDIV